MRKSGWSISLVEIGLCLVCLTSAGTWAGENAKETSPLEAWRRWLEAHPVPSIQEDKAEEAVVTHIFSTHNFGAIRQILIEREVRKDYLRQTALIGNKAHWKRVGETALRPEAVIRGSDHDPADFVLRTTRALLNDLQQGKSAESLTARERELVELEKRCSSIEPSRKAERFALYQQVCALRRQIALANPLLDCQSIVFVKHKLASYNHMCDQYFGRNARPGGSLYVLEDPFGNAPVLRDLLKDATVQNGRLRGQKLTNGSFLQPALSFDGKTVLFAYSECGQTKSSTLPGEAPPELSWNEEGKDRSGWTANLSYHVFRVNLDGSCLTQFTDGPWNDLHPNWLPDGRVVFVSERRGGFGRCHARPVPLYTLHAMDTDGKNMVRLSSHEGNEWHPSVNNDGMIVYSRWDYVDRGHNQAHHPWLTSPDGRDPRAIHGNFKPSHDMNPDMELNVRAIPASSRYVATASAHHGQAYGSLVVFDPRIPDDDGMAPVRRLTPDVGFPETAEHGAFAYGTAWPLSELYYLCVYGDSGDRHGIYLLDAFGNRELIYRDPDIGCLGPVPGKPRTPPPVLPPGGEPARLVDRPTFRGVGDEHAVQTTGTEKNDKAVMGLLNVYDSHYPFPQGVKIQSLRIIHLLPKSTPIHHQPQIGYGAETGARAALGTVPVEPDGSANFYLPTGMSVYFQALDERGCAVQSMRSGTYVQKGEKRTCVGCHEPKSRSPGGESLTLRTAFRREPSTIQPEVEGSYPFSFPRLVQPVLEKHCVQCHDSSPKAALPDLRQGTPQQDKFHWYQSYRGLRPYAFHYGAPRNDKVEHQYDGWQPARTVPGKFGARASKLLALLDKGHHDVKLNPQELRRIIVWLDTNSDFFGSYENVEAQVRGEVVLPRIR